MTTKPIGLYVHIPFCVQKCNYCDFCSFPCGELGWRDEYINALCKEISSYHDQNITLDSIFFGGGTPSLLSVDEFSRITSTIRKSFSIASDCEFTLEANPKTLTEEKLRSFIDFGVNRLSIGLQSINENEMKLLGRIHNFDDFLNSYQLARDLGISNINVDLMYGIPEQTKESFKQTLKNVLELSPEHISLYGLILEEGTPLYTNRDRLALPGEDTECDMYYLAAQELRDNGYIHYEISNYAKSDCQCRHNLKYWRDENFIGVGLSAYSYFDKKRYGNTKVPEEYLHKDCVKYRQEEFIDSKNEAYEFVMLALRLNDGFSLNEYRERFGSDFCLGREETICKLENAGYLRICGDRLSLTESGFYVSNSVIGELI